jgi:hypothetical protein
VQLTKALKKVSILLAVTVADEPPEISFLLTAGPQLPMTNCVSTPLLFDLFDLPVPFTKPSGLKYFHWNSKTI